jgi:hypothetical protein
MATGVVWRVRYTNRHKMALYCTLYYPLAKSVAMRRGRSGRAAESEKPSARSSRSRHSLRRRSAATPGHMTLLLLRESRCELLPTEIGY